MKTQIIDADRAIEHMKADRRFGQLASGQSVWWRSNTWQVFDADANDDVAGGCTLRLCRPYPPLPDTKMMIVHDVAYDDVKAKPQTEDVEGARSVNIERISIRFDQDTDVYHWSVQWNIGAASEIVSVLGQRNTLDEAVDAINHKLACPPECD